MKLGIGRMENNGNVTYLSQSQMMFMRINPITMKVERLNLDIGYCSQCGGIGCSGCNNTGMSEKTIELNTNKELWVELGDDYRIATMGEIH